MLKIDQLTAKNVQTYVTICRQYCEWVEQKDVASPRDFIMKLLELLPGVYRGNMRLPEVPARYTQEVERFVSEKQYKNVYRRLAQITGNRDKFPFISSPHEIERLSMAEASLSEFLADIYLDLKDFVSLYDTGTIEDMNDALAESQETFRQEWGIKVLIALNIMHLYCFGEQTQASGGSSFLPDEATHEGFDSSELQGFGTETE